MLDNPIEEWYKKDQKLNDLLVSIDKQNLSAEVAARQAFYKVSKLYNLSLGSWHTKRVAEIENKKIVFNFCNTIFTLLNGFCFVCHEPKRIPSARPIVAKVITC